MLGEEKGGVCVCVSVWGGGLGRERRSGQKLNLCDVMRPIRQLVYLSGVRGPA